MSPQISAVLGNFTDVFAVAGAVTVSYIVLKALFSLLKAFRVYILSRTSDIGPYLRSHGEWAVVTGATDGIGKAYAEQLASSGLNVVLISRTESKLRDVASAIESKYNVKTMVIPADFSQGTSIYDGIRRKLAGVDVGILVNNVGLSYDYPEVFLDLPDREQLFMNLMHVNCTSVTMMTSIVGPGMVEKKRGLVINLSSAAGESPTPMLTVYSACKAYVSYLTECLDHEYSQKGVRFQCVTPYFVCSNMSKIRKASLFIPSATTYVKSALATLGREWQTNGYGPHALMGWATRLLPDCLVRSFARKNFLAARARALKRMAGKKQN